MTKTQLKQLIRECLNEIDFAPGFRPTKDLTLVSTVTGSDVDHINKYISELHRVLKVQFDNDVEFEEKVMSTLPNNVKKIATTFKIINITDDEDLIEVKKILQEIEEGLTMWSITQDLVIEVSTIIKN